MYQLQVITRQADLVEQIAEGTYLEQLLLGVYQREWLGLLQEAQQHPLPRHYRSRVQQAQQRLEVLSRLAHSLPWQEQRQHLLEAALLLR